MSDISSYRDLQVWQKSIDLVTDCYRLSSKFPPDERFGLTSQLRRAATSVPANIAEGNGRGTTKSFVHFLWIANGSLAELETHILIAERLGFVTREDTRPLFEAMSTIGRMLTGLRRSLKQSMQGDCSPF
ncbi:MAG: four helix bundle protein [Planctomycetaceae bacterium]|nr:four helix bundle protein [Planctomycetaceae bacterium]